MFVSCLARSGDHIRSSSCKLVVVTAALAAGGVQALPGDYDLSYSAHGSTRAIWVGTASAAYDTTYKNLLPDDAGRVLPRGRSNYLSPAGAINFGRLQNDRAAGFACTMDIDGDRKVLATTDGVLLARAMPGVTGPRWR